MELEQYLLNFILYRYHLGFLLKCRYGSVGLGWGLKFCISNKSLDDVCVSGPCAII